MSLKKWLPVILIALAVIAIDQLAKIWVVNNMMIGESRLILEGLQPYLQLTRSTNTGFAFGLASGGNSIILVLSSIITLGLIWLIYQSDESERFQQFALAMVIGGAIGNIIDRIRFNHVVDFVHVYIPGFVSNVSNFADHFVVIGVILLLIDSIWQELQQPQNNEPMIDDTLSNTDE